MSRRILSALFLLLPLPLLPLAASCSSRAPAEQQTVSVKTIPGHDTLPEDTSAKEAPRLMLSEAYMRSYLQLFGGLSAMNTQDAMHLNAGYELFDFWDDYLVSLGFPVYETDIPRQQHPNAVMMATFERIGIALCDRALEHDWKATPATPADKRLIFTFDMPTGELNERLFERGLDALHRTFLGYPVALAPTERVKRFYDIYNGVVAAHTTTTRFTAPQAGWAAMCYALLRHPEFHLY